MSELYEIVKFYDEPGKPARVQRKVGKLSRTQAQRVCSGAESKSSPSTPIGKKWFYGFRRIS